MRFDVLTLFPGAFAGPVDESILGRARAAGHFELHLHDIREHATDRHRTVDDYPFGGGQGMLLRVDVLDRALSHAQSLAEYPGKVVYLSPAGRVLNDRLVRELAREPRLVLVCGRYEGVDQRFIDHRVDIEVSIGDYVLTGGELPAMVLIDAVARHVPGVLGDELSPEEESFAGGLLEHPHYTRPADYQGWAVPPVLMTGDHARIEEWRRQQRVSRTAERRPDLLPPAPGADASLRRVGIDGIRLRQLSYPGDVPAVMELLRESGVASDLTPIGLSSLIRENQGLLLVAEQAHLVVATAIAGFDGHRATVYAVAVSPNERGRGIGTALLAELERALRLADCRMVSWLAPSSVGATGFLKARGWRPTEAQCWERKLADS